MKTIVTITLILLVSLTAMTTASAQTRDYRSQALFMYNFIKYVNWPVSSDNFVIGVMGDCPITPELNKLASIKKTPDGKTITVLMIDDLTKIDKCNMVYVPDGYSKDISKLVLAVQGRPALIVSERDGLTKKGAEISFFTQDDDKLGFSISRKNMDHKKLKASGELLRLAELAD